MSDDCRKFLKTTVRTGDAMILIVQRFTKAIVVVGEGKDGSGTVGLVIPFPAADGTLCGISLELFNIAPGASDTEREAFISRGQEVITGPNADMKVIDYRFGPEYECPTILAEATDEIGHKVYGVFGVGNNKLYTLEETTDRAAAEDTLNKTSQERVAKALSETDTEGNVDFPLDLPSN